MAQRSRKAKAKTEPEVPAIEHPGRGFVTAISIAGAVLVFGSSAAAYMYGDLDLLPALLVPWAGFYWAKLFCWRGSWTNLVCLVNLVHPVLKSQHSPHVLRFFFLAFVWMCEEPRAML